MQDMGIKRKKELSNPQSAVRTDGGTRYWFNVCKWVLQVALCYLGYSGYTIHRTHHETSKKNSSNAWWITSWRNCEIWFANLIHCFILYNTSMVQPSSCLWSGESPVKLGLRDEHRRTGWGVRGVRGVSCPPPNSGSLSTLILAESRLFGQNTIHVWLTRI